MATLSMRMTVRLRVREVTKELQDAARKAITDMTQDIASKASQKAPVGPTGRTKRNIGREVGWKTDGWQGEVFTETGYGKFVEGGTKTVAGRPFLFPAGMEVLPNWPAYMKRYIP